VPADVGVEVFVVGFPGVQVARHAQHDLLLHRRVRGVQAPVPGQSDDGGVECVPVLDEGATILPVDAVLHVPQRRVARGQTLRVTDRDPEFHGQPLERRTQREDLEDVVIGERGDP
jgi:hypothetical protein